MSRSEMPGVPPHEAATWRPPATRCGQTRGRTPSESLGRRFSQTLRRKPRSAGATHFRLLRKGFYFTAAEAQIHGRESESIIVSENITALSFREHIHYYAQADRLLV